MQEAALTRELEAGGEAGESAASRVSWLLDRGMVRLLTRSYDAAREVRCACVCARVCVVYVLGYIASTTLTG